MVTHGSTNSGIMTGAGLAFPTLPHAHDVAHHTHVARDFTDRKTERPAALVEAARRAAMFWGEVKKPLSGARKMASGSWGWFRVGAFGRRILDLSDARYTCWGSCRSDRRLQLDAVYIVTRTLWLRNSCVRLLI